MRSKIKLTIIAISTLLSFNAIAEDPKSIPEANDPAFLQESFKCTPEETKAFIEGQTFHLKLPKGVPNEQELVDAYVQAICEEDPDSPECQQSCFQMPDFEFDQDWQKLLDKVNDLLSKKPNFTSFSEILNRVEQAVNKAVDKIMEKIAEGICDAADLNKIKDELSKRANGVIKDKYGLDMDNLDESSLDLLEDALEDRYGSDADYFFDPDKISEDIKDETMDKIKEKDDRFWKGI